MINKIIVITLRAAHPAIKLETKENKIMLQQERLEPDIRTPPLQCNGPSREDTFSEMASLLFYLEAKKWMK